MENSKIEKTQKIITENSKNLFQKPRNYLKMANRTSIIFDEEEIKIPKNFFSKKLKESSDNLSYEKSIWIELNEVENDFKNLKIKEKQELNYCIKDEDLEMSSINLELSKLPYYDQYINDLSEDDFNETNNSSFIYNIEYDIPDFTRDEKIRGKIISNAIEIEKTARKYFDVDLKLIPNKR